MIEKMKKLTLICLKEDKKETLEALRELGVMHVVQSQNGVHSEDLTDIRQKIDKLKEIIVFLEPHCDADCKTRSFPEYDDKETIEILKEAWKAKHDITWLEENITNHHRMFEQLEPWGEFDGKLLDDIRQKGMDVKLCCCDAKEMPTAPEEVCFQEISRVGSKVYFAAISTETIEMDLPETQVHTETSLSELKERSEHSEKAIATMRGKLQIFANYMSDYTAKLDELLEKEEFIVNRNGMGDVEDFAYLTGYIPTDDEEQVKDAALTNGWAIQTTDADPEDNAVPTKLTIPKWANMSKPLFNFLGITPSYAENDVSVSVLLFLSLFFAMLIGDAGYGILFLVLAFAGKRKVKDKEKQLPLNLFILFSAVTTVWGWMSGTFFGIDNSSLPSFMQGLEWFTGGGGESNVKWLCFLIAAVHLSMARIWNVILLKKFPVKAAANLGWAIFIWGNFYMACSLLLGADFPEHAKWMYIIGGVIVVFTDINFVDIGSVINAPFAFINSFVDVLSYIRLFAVGFASVKIAESFNGMAASMYDDGGFGILKAILIVGMGHMLNIVLGFMAVLVHGVRLNTLEFSNHMGITWGGLFYSPFKKNIEIKNK